MRHRDNDKREIVKVVRLVSAGAERTGVTNDKGGLRKSRFSLLLPPSLSSIVLCHVFIEGSDTLHVRIFFRFCFVDCHLSRSARFRGQTAEQCREGRHNRRTCMGPVRRQTAAGVAWVPSENQTHSSRTNVLRWNEPLRPPLSWIPACLPPPHCESIAFVRRPAAC